MPQTRVNRDRYAVHRAALAPIIPGATNADLESACSSAIELGEAGFAEFLCHQGLAPLWDERIEQYPGQLPVSAEFTNMLHQARLHATGSYLIQRHNLARLKEILDKAGVMHAVIKGAHTREVYYAIPALRPATDIDVLVRPRDKVRAIKAFQAQGFEFTGAPETISHEASLARGNTAIDLHWDILRPGRTRVNMVDQLLDDRMLFDSHWGISPAATLFLMLAHPVFTKYTTTPQATLVRLVDMALLLARQPEAVVETGRLLQLAGLKTAGWVTTHWLQMLTGSETASELGKALKPGAMRRLWFKSWLAGDWSSRLLDQAWLIQLGFTLPAHDSWIDAARASRNVQHCRKEGPATLEFLKLQLG